MDNNYVAALVEPKADMEYVRRDVKFLVNDKSYSESLINYAITNFLKSLDAYLTDYDSEKRYYRITLADQDRNLVIFHQNLAHLLGLPDYRVLQEAAIINDLLIKRHAYLNSHNCLRIFTILIRDAASKAAIIDHDTDEYNYDVDKLNWDKIAYKVFCFLNLGLLSEKESYYYQLRKSNPNDRYMNRRDSDVIIMREIYSSGANKCLRFELNKEKYGDDEILIPRSIRVVKADQLNRQIEGYRRMNLLGVTLEKGNLYA